MQLSEQTDLEIIFKLGKDADLRYLYTGPRKKGRGRSKKYDGKIKLNKIDRTIESYKAGL